MLAEKDPIKFNWGIKYGDNDIYKGNKIRKEGAKKLAIQTHHLCKPQSILDIKF